MQAAVAAEEFRNMHRRGRSRRLRLLAENEGQGCVVNRSLINPLVHISREGTTRGSKEEAQERARAVIFRNIVTELLV